MARITFLLVLFLVPALAPAQNEEDKKFQQAGVCARCHVISVVEWGISKHQRVGTDCKACHGESQGHVIDERNNIKPDRIPHDAAIKGLCADCHKDQVAKSKNKAGCQTCHHVHALINPSKPAVAKDERREETLARWKRYEALIAEGEGEVKAFNWPKARAAFAQALEQKPADPAATERIRMCDRRMKPQLAGFEIIGNEFDARTGLPKRVKAAGVGIPMLLVAGGEFEMGSEKFASAKPVHTIRVEPFYLGQYELTQEEWKSVMGADPSAHQGAGLPVENVSWEDCAQFVQRVNSKVPGAGFRLPTEAEWEFAARSGNAPTPPSNTGATQPVGKGQANSLALYDMQGNVWEWTSSRNMPYPYVASDGRERPDAAGMRILRGGGFADSAVWFDPGARHSERPDRRLRSNGIRLARSIPE